MPPQPARVEEPTHPHHDAELRKRKRNMSERETNAQNRQSQGTCGNSRQGRMAGEPVDTCRCGCVFASSGAMAWCADEPS